MVIFSSGNYRQKKILTLIIKSKYISMSEYILQLHCFILKLYSSKINNLGQFKFFFCSLSRFFQLDLIIRSLSSINSKSFAIPPYPDSLRPCDKINIFNDFDLSGNFKVYNFTLMLYFSTVPDLRQL